MISIPHQNWFFYRVALAEAFLCYLFYYYYSLILTRFRGGVERGG